MEIVLGHLNYCLPALFAPNVQLGHVAIYVTRKALTRGRTDHLAVGVTFLVSNSGLLFLHVVGTGFPSLLFYCRPKKGTFSSRDLEL